MITVFVEYELDDERDMVNDLSKIIKERLEKAGHVDDIEVIAVDMEGN
jgi:5-bromo-4-chloroindolyl phosphate hydrolysis protein